MKGKKWKRTLGTVLALALAVSGTGLLPAKTVKAANETSEDKSYHWETYDGKSYWYENGEKQGTVDDKQGVIGDGTVRGREICDPAVLDEKGNGTWFWLDAVYDGAKACNKEVWMPYIYSNEKDFDEEAIKQNAAESGDMAAQVEKAMRAARDGVTDSSIIGKWVRYDADGKMIKGWYTVEGEQAKIPEYKEQIGNTYYYDFKTGLMAKGTVTIDGEVYKFDETTGALVEGKAPIKDSGSTEGENKKDTVEEALAKIAKASVGDTVTFGSYEQDADASNGKEAIEWYVLEKQDKKYLLLAKCALDTKPYHETYTDVTWEICTLRGWLNDEFYKAAFDEGERAHVELSALTNSDNPVYDTAGGKQTKDKVFLLSLAELEKYFPAQEKHDQYWLLKDDAKLFPQGTKQAYENGLVLYELEKHDDGDYYTNQYFAKDRGNDYDATAVSNWYLRTPGDISRRVATVEAKHAYVAGESVGPRAEVGIRPAIWLNLDVVKDDAGDDSTENEFNKTDKNETAEQALAKIAKAEIGDIVTFGSYEQDNNDENGMERIQWYVLDKKDGQATLLSVKIIEAGRYHYNSDYVSWATCGLRGWLNDNFYKMAFTAEEQNVIATTLITNSDNPVYPSTLDGDGDTEDKVWLLSLEEVSKYFNIPMSPDVVKEYNLTNPNNYSKKSHEYAIYCYNQDNRILAKPTTYALKRHNAEIWTEEDTEYYKKEYALDFGYANGAGWWWLRSPGRYHNEAAAVNYNGEVQYYGFLNYNGYAGDDEKGTLAVGAWRGGIRPAINVNY